MLRRSHAVRNGLILFALIVGYFLLLDALGWADNVLLMLINYVFIIAILNNTIKHSVKNGEGYLNKLMIGVVTIFIGVSLSVITLYFYFEALQPSLERYVLSIIPAENYVELSMVLFIQSFSSSIIIVFIMLQFYKNKAPREVEV